ncbi:hypothetical protein [Kitasatospora kifunensis]|uniref:Uncharacterized protein n=1 Tax=Kitasatospora kifunensis TaxID=58351 RepID=A0A7W7RB44_KITKI|nr:hypothetical protein [Kitasatospora kifunensis]MBB4928106.1 hypothetical protein [Kitasatospora kifunensis]
MITSYSYDDGRELRRHDAEQNLNCPPDLELSKLTVDHVLRLSAITAAQPTVVAANQRLLTLFATLPTPDDEDDPNFRFDLQSAGDTLYLMEANIAGWIQLTFAYPTETALARCILDAFRMLDAEHRAAVAEVVGKRLSDADRAVYTGELWIRAVEQAAFTALIADKAPSDPEAVQNFRNSWLRA